MDQDYFKIHEDRKYWIRKKLIRRYQEFRRRKKIDENEGRQVSSQNSKEVKNSF